MELIQTIPAFPVHNIDTATNFYESKMGFKCQHKNKEFARLTRDNVELHLWASSDIRWKWRGVLLFLKPVQSGAESFLAGTHSCRMEVKEIDKLFDEFRTKQILSKRAEVKKTDWGTREFEASDLHGNLITFYERQSP